MKRGTNINLLFTLLLAVISTWVFYLIVVNQILGDSHLYKIFAERTFIQYITTFSAIWAFWMLGWKFWLLRKERKTMEDQLVLPVDPDSKITRHEAGKILEKIKGLSGAVRERLVITRIERALDRFRKIGTTSEVDDILRDQSSLDEGALATSYIPVKTLIWVIPMIGFLGTILGMSGAIGDFSQIVTTVGDFEGMKVPLGEVTRNLSVAFDTTLLALVFAIMVMFVMSGMQQVEERFLTELEDFCTVNILGKMITEEEVESSASRIRSTLEQIQQMVAQGMDLGTIQQALAAALTSSDGLLGGVTEIKQTLDALQPTLEKMAAPRKWVITEERTEESEE